MALMLRLPESVIPKWELIVKAVMSEADRLHNVFIDLFAFLPGRIWKECSLFSFHNAVGDIDERCSQISDNNM